MCMDSPKVSVLVPIYNVEKYLRKCLDSIVNQTLRDIEIICINDGSTDSSPEIIREYVASDCRVRMLDKKNTGYGNSMNMGLDMARGEYIGIVESDDFAELDMFEKLYSMAKSDDLDVARSEFYFYTSTTETNEKTNTGYVPHNKVFAPRDDRSVFYQQPSIWANIYRASFLRENNIRFLETPGASYQDTGFSFKVYAAAERFEMMDEAFLHYRINEGSSSFQSNSKIYCVCDEYEEIWRYVKESSLYEDYRYLIPRLQYNGYKWNYNRLADPYDKEFMIRWRADFVKLDEEGNIRGSGFTGEELADIHEILQTGTLPKNIPRLSVIVPVYNMEQYLRKCLDSIVNQTVKDIEIICVNDGSKDKSQAILGEYAKKDRRIKVLKKSNGGLSSARNAGLKVAKARYVTFVDSDDWIEPDTYECVLAHINGADIVAFGTNVVGDAMIDRRSADDEYYRVKYEGLHKLNDSMRLNMDVAAWNKVYRRDIIEEKRIDFPEGLLYEDYSFFWKYIVHCKNAFFIKERKYNYLRRDGSIMQTTFSGNRRAIEHLPVFDGILRYYESCGLMSNMELRTLDSMFLNCFWFAYGNSPQKLKMKVLREASCIADRMISSDRIITALKQRRYDKVDTRKAYSAKVRMLSRILGWAERSVGGDLSTARKMVYGTYRGPKDCSDSVATTDWVRRHEDVYGIERWECVYDSRSSDQRLNWGTKGGIHGSAGVSSARVREIFVHGCEYRATLTLWGAESAVLQGVVVHSGLSIVGTSIYDGINVFTVSLRVEPDNSALKVLAVDWNGIDHSEHCRLLKIERRVV